MANEDTLRRLEARMTGSRDGIVDGAPSPVASGTPTPAPGSGSSRKRPRKSVPTRRKSTPPSSTAAGSGPSPSSGAKRARPLGSGAGSTSQHSRTSRSSPDASSAAAAAPPQANSLTSYFAHSARAKAVAGKPALVQHASATSVASLPPSGSTGLSARVLHAPVSVPDPLPQSNGAGASSAPSHAAPPQPSSTHTSPALKQALDDVAWHAKRMKELTEETQRQAEEVAALRLELRTNKEQRAAELRRVGHRMAKFTRRLNEKVVTAHRRHLTDEQHRLGSIVVHRTAADVGEAWKNGAEVLELLDREKRLKARVDALQKEQRKARSRRNKHAAVGGDAGGADSPSMRPPAARVPGRPPALTPEILSELEVVAADDSIRMQLSALRRELATVQERVATLDSAKKLLVHELRRVRDEDVSSFAHRPLLNDKYQLLQLLGKGGFSEVWLALDVTRCVEVAVKVHQLNSAWSQSRKASYIKHATREYNIHKAMDHPNVVRLFDVFEIHEDSFATVLEFCPGNDLDHLLKGQATLPEREARGIVLQVLAALRYFNGLEGGQAGAAGEAKPPSGRRVIHYDLKPANILFDENKVVKVTDFGLSKVMDVNPELTSMELTSQGAGTYYYLPPECFASKGARISDKVDVWSVGVIFYQMLFGRRPFGEGQSQEVVAAQSLISKAPAVSFPDKPAVSPECQEFIRACLTKSQVMRPDVAAISAHPYLRAKLK